MVQLCSPHPKHIAVMVSEELPQAAHVFVLGPVTVLVCQVRGCVGDSTEVWALPTPWTPVDRSRLSRDSLPAGEGSYTPLLASWYLRLAWALSRARDRYWLFSFSMSWLWVWGERRDCVDWQVPRAFLPEVKHWTGLTVQAGSILESILQKGPGDLWGQASDAEVRVRGSGLGLSPWRRQSGLGRLELPFFGLGWYLMAGRAQLKACGTELHA